MARYDPDRRGYRIFVGNLSAGTMHDDLADLFCPYGPIVDIWLACNPPGFGFVVFKNAEDAQNAVLGKNNSILNSRVIKVQHARMFKDRSKRKTTDQQGQSDSEGSRESRSTTRSRSRTYSRSRSRSRSRLSSFSKIYGYPNRHRSSSRLSSKRDSRSLSSSHSSYRTLSVASSSSRSGSNSPPRSTTTTRSKKRLRQRNCRPKKHRRCRGKKGDNRQRRYSSGSSRASARSANYTLRSRSSSRSSSSSTSSSSTSSLSPSSLTSARKSQSHHSRCPYCRHCCVPRPGRKTTSRSSQHISEFSPSSLSSDVSKDAGSLHRKMRRRRAWRHSKRRRRQRSLSTSSSSSSSSTSETSSTMPIKMSSHSRILDYQLRSPAKEVEPKTTQLQPAAEAQESDGANVSATQFLANHDVGQINTGLSLRHHAATTSLKPTTTGASETLPPSEAQRSAITQAERCIRSEGRPLIDVDRDLVQVDEISRLECTDPDHNEIESVKVQSADDHVVSHLLAPVPLQQSISSKDGDKCSTCLKASHFLQPSGLGSCCRAMKSDENGVSAARVLPTETHRTQNIQHDSNQGIKEATVPTTCDEGKIELLLTGEGKTGLIQTDEGRSELTHNDESKEGLIFTAKGKVGLFLNDEDRSDLKLTDEGKPKLINYSQENTHIDVDRLAVERLKDNGLICTELSVKQLADKQLANAVLPVRQLTSTELPVQQLTNNELPIKQLTDKELTNAEMPVKRVTDDVSTSSALPVKRLAENRLRSTELTVNRLKINRLIKSGPVFELQANKLNIRKSTHENMVPKVYSRISLSTPGDGSTQCFEDGFVFSKCSHSSESASRKCSEQVNILTSNTVPDVNDGNSSDINTQSKTLSVEDDSVQSSPIASRKSHQCRLGAHNMDSLFWKLKQKTCQISNNKWGGTHVSLHSKDCVAKQEVPLALAVQNTESPPKESLSKSPLSQGTKTRDARKARSPATEHIPVARSPTVKRIPVKFSLSQGQHSNTPQTLASSEPGQKQQEFQSKEDNPLGSEKCGKLRDISIDELLSPDREDATVINFVSDNCKMTEDNVKTCKIEAAHPSVNGQEMHFVLRNDKPLRNGAESMSHSTALRNSSHKYHATDKSNRPQRSQGRKEHMVANVVIVSSPDQACKMFSSGRDDDSGPKNGVITLSKSEAESWGRSAKRPRTCIHSPPGGQEDSKRMYSHKMKATQFSTEQTGKRFLAEASKLHNDVAQNFLDTVQTKTGKAECHPQNALPQPKLSSLSAPVLPKSGLSSKITCALSRPELSSSSTKSHPDMSRHTSAHASKRSRSNSYAFRHNDFDVRSTAIPDPHPRAYETCRKRDASACRWNGKDKPVSCRRHSHRGSSKCEHSRDSLRWFSEQRQRSTSRERWKRRETMLDRFSRRLVSPSQSKRRDKIKESRETSRSRHSVSVVTRGRNVDAASKCLDDKNKRYERNNHKQRGDLMPKRPDGIRAESRGRCRSENKKLHRSSRQRSSQLHNGEKGGRSDIRLTSSVHVVKHRHR